MFIRTTIMSYIFYFRLNSNQMKKILDAKVSWYNFFLE